jgi:four helix bundle protein
MNAEILKARTKAYAVAAIKFYASLPKSEENQVLGKQFLRSSTSVAGNYRAACRGRSTKEFYAKICIVVEEGDESLFWLELFNEAELVSTVRCAPLMKECQELVKIFSSTKRTMGDRLNGSGNKAA